jgi:putative FmdB family regulatory protein
MPIYEYTCDECGRSFELLLANPKSKAACPHCGSVKLAKQFSTFAAHNASASPCDSGKCPGQMPSGGCGGGSCPFK